MQDIDREQVQTIAADVGQKAMKAQPLPITNLCLITPHLS